MLKNALSLALLLTLIACSSEQTRQPSETEPNSEGVSPETRLTLETSPLVELYFTVRAMAADPEAEIPPGYEEAVAGARALQETMGSFGGWGRFDTFAFVVESATEMREQFEGYPEPMEFRGREVSLRDDAVRFAAGLEAVEDSFALEFWPGRQAVLELRTAWLEEAFLPKHQDALAYMMDSLGIEDPRVEVPVYLTTQLNPPGAMTYHLRGGLPVVVVDVMTRSQGDQLIEVLLHESAHTLDQASKGSDDAFEVLRTLLAEKGVGRRDYLYQAVPHGIMFLQAEEATRRFYNPDHVAYGDSFGVYEDLGGIARVEQQEWGSFLAGEQSREEALTKIVAAMRVDLPKEES